MSKLQRVYCTLTIITAGLSILVQIFSIISYSRLSQQMPDAMPQTPPFLAQNILLGVLMLAACILIVLGLKKQKLLLMLPGLIYMLFNFARSIVNFVRSLPQYTAFFQNTTVENPGAAYGQIVVNVIILLLIGAYNVLGILSAMELHKNSQKSA